MNARHYNRSVKAHKSMVEALWRLYWQQFIQWIQMEDYSWRLDSLNIALEELYSEFTDQNITTDMDNVIKEKLNVSTIKCTINCSSFLLMVFKFYLFQTIGCAHSPEKLRSFNRPF